MNPDAGWKRKTVHPCLHPASTTAYAVGGRISHRHSTSQDQSRLIDVDSACRPRASANCLRWSSDEQQHQWVVGPPEWPSTRSFVVNRGRRPGSGLACHRGRAT